MSHTEQNINVMKTLFIKISFFILLLLTMGAGCEIDRNNYNPNSIIGKWMWLYSTGGFAGNTIYPKKGQTVTLELTKDSLFIERDNGETEFEAEFSVLGDTLKYIVYDAAIFCKIKILEDTLSLCYFNVDDGYDPVYKRMK
jgi:hypothetical protein